MRSALLRRLGILLLLSSVVLSAGTARAQSAPTLNLTTYELENGLKVILVEDHSAPTVAVDVWYHVGGANDPPGRSGFAHLFEHMMFQGSAHVPRGAHSRLIAEAGGNSNATTGRDRTNYFETLPSHQLPLALWLEADRMASLVVDEENFQREREVVKEEYRLRVENQPYGQAQLALQTLPFDYPPYRQPVIGSVEDLDRATVDEVRAFHQTYYKPNNAVLAVAGDIDVDQTRELVERYFGPIPRQDPPPALPPFEPGPPAGGRTVTMSDPQARVPALFLAYPLPPRSHADYPALDVLARILGDGDSSRLARALIDSGLATAANTLVLGNRGPSLFGVILVPNPGVEVAQIEQAYEQELAKIAAGGADPAELSKVVNTLRTQQVNTLQSAYGLAESVQEANFYLGSPQAVVQELERYRAVTSADLQRVAQAYLTESNRYRIEVMPAQEEGG